MKATAAQPLRGVQDVLDEAVARGVDHGRAVVEAHCGCGWSAYGRLCVVRQGEDGEWVEEVIVRDACGDEWEAGRWCDWCERDLLPELLFERRPALEVLRAAAASGDVPRMAVSA